MPATMRARAQVPAVAAKVGVSASEDGVCTLVATGVVAGAGNVIMQGVAATTPAVYGDLTHGVNFPDSECSQLSFQVQGDGTFNVSLTFTAGGAGASVGDQLWFAIHNGAVTVDPSTPLQILSQPLTVIT